MFPEHRAEGGREGGGGQLAVSFFGLLILSFLLHILNFESKCRTITVKV